MSQINISELKPFGSDLFYDSENFLNELSDDDIIDVTGGMVISQVTVTAGYKLVRANDVNFVGIAKRVPVMNFTRIPGNWQNFFKRWSFFV